MPRTATTRLIDDTVEAAAALRAGRLVAFPTETVYGLGADAANPSALCRLYAVKRRPPDHPSIVHIGEIEHLREWAAEVSPEAEALARAFWPGPLTLILPRAPGVPDQVTGGQPTVGLRMPDHPLALALLREFGGGVAAPSANRFGRVSPTRPEHVLAELGPDVDVILKGGASRVGVESTILSLVGEEPVILRPGHVSAAQVEAVIGRPVQVQVRAGETRAPGTLAAHYSPATPLRVLEREPLLDATNVADGPIAVLARFAPPTNLGEEIHWRQAPADAEAFAHRLYADVRELDELGLGVILVEAVPADDPAWLAVADRLSRAAAVER